MKTTKHKYSKKYFTGVTVKSSSSNQRYISILSNLGIKLKGMTVCDIGCADGSFLDLIDKECTCYGCDISAHIIKKAQKTIPDFKDNFAVIDLNKEVLPFKTKFDLITMFDVIEHLNNFGPLSEIISTKLKMGGYFLVTTPNAQSLLRFITPQSFTGEVDMTHTMLFTPYTMDFYLRRLGLKKVVLSTPYSFYFKNNKLTQNILLGGQILALYQKIS